MSQKKEDLKSIRSNLFMRGLSLAKVSLQASRAATSSWLSPATGLAQIEAVIRQLGELKGSAMKVGQTLSMYGEHLLPKEINDLLKTLQQSSPPLAWPAIEKILREQLGPERYAQLVIEPQSLAAASIGQVHRAKVKATGQNLALKIQYPGIDQAVDTDLKLLKFILGISDLIPRGPRFDQIFSEIRDMFLQEIDYSQELRAGLEFADLLQGDCRFVVARPVAAFSTPKVLTSELVTGHRADSPEVQALSQERRNLLGAHFLELYLKELLVFQRMQTDPHLGNYMVQIDPAGDRLVLLDFGAVRSVPDEFLQSYRLLMEGGIRQDPRLIEKGGRLLGLLRPDDGLDLVQDYIELCLLLTEPFNSGLYDWGQSDLPKRVAAQAARVIASYKLRAPPRELVFLDRKLGGVFIFLSVLGCVMDGRPLLERALAGEL